MIPLKDDNPTYNTPIVVYALITINIAVFLHEMSLGSGLDGFFQLYAVIPRELSASFSGTPVNQPVPEIATLITSQFLHGGLMHIGGNMLFLWTFGDNIEGDLGHVKFPPILFSLRNFSRFNSLVLWNAVWCSHSWC
jgi:membrane associated rhomboid family serine protease